MTEFSRRSALAAIPIGLAAPSAVKAEMPSATVLRRAVFLQKRFPKLQIEWKGKQAIIGWNCKKEMMDLGLIIKEKDGLLALDGPAIDRLYT